MRKVSYVLIVLGFFLLAVVFSQKKAGRVDIAGTRWRFLVAEYNNEKYYNYIIFLKDSSYEYYSCELGSKFWGSYSLKGDTVVVVEDSTEYCDSDIEVIEIKKYYIKDDTLWFFLRLDRGKYPRKIENIYYLRDTTYVEE